MLKDLKFDNVIEYACKWQGILIISIILYFLVKFIKNQIFIRKHGCKEPVYYHGSFLEIRSLIELLKEKRRGGMVDYVYKMFLEVGVTFAIKLVGVRVVFTKDPENMKAILATQFNDFALGIRHAHFKPLLGDGIFTLDGEGWKHSRAMLRPQFAREQIAHVHALEKHVQLLIKHIKKHSAGETFDLQELFFKLTVDTATEFLFGQSVQSLRDESIGILPENHIECASEFADAFNTSQAYLGTRAYSQFLYWLINPADFRKNNEIVHKFARHYVKRALEATPEELEKRSSDGYIFLYELVKQTRDPKVLQDQLLNIMVAGRDTTAGLLSFTFMELARNPDIWKKLREEININFGLGENSDIDSITFESLKKCEYLKSVVNEALRLYPSVPINFRVSTKDTTLPRGGGPDGTAPVFVEKGTTVAYSVYATHRDEEYYGKDALEFKPERWANLKKVGWAYLPFNGGPRICLGQQFALIEASYIITRLVQTFSHLESRDSEYPCLKNVQLTMSHQKGVYVSMSE